MIKQMIRTILAITFITFSFAWSDNAFERHCIPCHKDLPTNLQGMFKNYLLVYSGEQTVKAAMKHYMRYPSKHISVMSDLFIDTYGIKKRLNISDQVLQEAIDIYWEKYKVFGKLEYGR